MASRGDPDELAGESMSPLEAQWRKGPTTDHVVEAHDRSILCMALRQDAERVVTGSADHSLKEFEWESGRCLRTLYSKTAGHSEWVTCVDYLPNGGILSGAMDSKLCLWHPEFVRCTDLTEHRSSISAVKVDSRSFAVSSSYDGSLIVWDLNSRPRSVCHLSGHKKAVLNFFWRNSLVISCGRDGLLGIWDVNTGTMVETLKGHSQPIQCADVLSSAAEDCNVCVSGSWDGEARVWDLRSGSCLEALSLHPQSHINSLAAIGDSSSMDAASAADDSVVTSGRSFVTAGADGLLKVVDVVGGCRVRTTLSGHRDAVGTIGMWGRLAVSGAANGWILVHDTDSGKCLYGVGASREAVRCVKLLSTIAAIGGDDGTMMMLSFGT